MYCIYLVSQSVRTCLNKAGRASGFVIFLYFIPAATAAANIEINAVPVDDVPPLPDN